MDDVLKEVVFVLVMEQWLFVLLEWVWCVLFDLVLCECWLFVVDFVDLQFCLCEEGWELGFCLCDVQFLYLYSFVCFWLCVDEDGGMVLIIVYWFIDWCVLILLVFNDDYCMVMCVV